MALGSKIAAVRERDPRVLAELAWALGLGAVQRHKFDRCGPWLRTAGRIRCYRANGSVVVGSRVLMWPGVMLSVRGERAPAPEQAPAREHGPAPEQGPARLVIGDRTTLGNRTEIHCGRRVSIGADCRIAWDVVIMDRDFHRLDADREEAAQPVVVNDRVWIGCRALVLKGVTIGSGAVVAAGSVVTSPVPAGALVAGNPARVVRTDVDWAP